MKFWFSALVVFLFAALAAGWCAVIDRDPKRALVRGKASFYGEGYRGKRMANGQRFDPSARTCASFHFPMGAVLRVKNPITQRAVIVTVTDRGPALRLNRLIDLSERAFMLIAPRAWGVIDVEVEILAAESETEENAAALPHPEAAR